MTPLRQRMIDDMRVRNLSVKTIAIYVAAVAKFAQFFHRSPDLLGPEEIRTYQVHLVQEKKVSWSAFNIAVSALKFVYTVTLAKDWAVQKIPCAKNETGHSQHVGSLHVFRSFLQPEVSSPGHDCLRHRTAAFRGAASASF